MTQATAQAFIQWFNIVAQAAHENSVARGFWPNGDRNTGEALMLAVTEISEGVEGLRCGNPPDDKVPEFSAIEAEMADAFLRMMDLAKGRKWRVAEAIVAKMKMNTTRGERHGKEF